MLKMFIKRNCNIYILKVFVEINYVVYKIDVILLIFCM